MSNINFYSELVKIAMLVNNERILVIDENISLINEIRALKLNVDISYCDPDDFTTITKYSEDYMNAFDVVFCPYSLYNINAENRQLVLQFIVWSMKESSRLAFSVPNINNLIGKHIIWKGKKYIIREKERFFKVIECKSLFRINTWFRKKIEYWHKTTVRFPLHVFRCWNTENPISQWNLENIAIKNAGDFVFCSLDIKKHFKKAFLE